MFSLTTDTVLYLQLVNVSTVEPPFPFVSSKNLVPGEQSAARILITFLQQRRIESSNYIYVSLFFFLWGETRGKLTRKWNRTAFYLIRPWLPNGPESSYWRPQKILKLTFKSIKLPLKLRQVCHFYYGLIMYPWKGTISIALIFPLFWQFSWAKKRESNYIM